MNTISLEAELSADLRLEEEILFGLRPRPQQTRPEAAAPVRPPAMPPDVPTGLAGVREQARREPARRFASLLHYVDVELLQLAYHRLREEGVRGGGGRTWTDYGRNLLAHTVRLYTRLQHGGHRTLPSWRRMLAVAQGQRQPLKRAALKDRIVQRAVAEVLLAVYQADFLPFAVGEQPLRLRDDALLRLAAQLQASKSRWVVELSLSDLYGSIACKSLLRCLRGRIADERLLALVERWARAGVMEDPALSSSVSGQPGNAIGGLLANIYCHYVFDLWSVRWRQRHARSPVILLRDAGRLVAAFEYKPGARRFMGDLRAHLRQYAPSLPARSLRLCGAHRYARECLRMPAQAGE
jgi:retron-type reverse transcriptase